MKRPILLSMLLASAICATSQTGSISIKIADLGGTGAIFDERLASVPLIFDKLNSLTLPCAESNLLRHYDSSFELLDIEESPVYFSGGSLWNSFDSAFYGRYSTFIILKDGREFLRELEGSPSSEAGMFGNLLLYPVQAGDKTLTGYLFPEKPGAPGIKVGHEDILKYVRDAGSRLKLSLSDDVVLYRGIPWYDYGFRNVWGNGEIGGYCSMDKDGNIYSFYSVWNSEGKEIKKFDLGRELDGGVINQISFDFEGNMYQLRNRELFYLGRDWGYPDASKGVATGLAVKLRLHPGINELVIAEASPGQVSVFEKTLQLETIGGIIAPWYKVQDKDGIVGWLHGSFLSMPEAANLPVFDSPALGLRSR